MAVVIATARAFFQYSDDTNVWRAFRVCRDRMIEPCGGTICRKQTYVILSNVEMTYLAAKRVADRMLEESDPRICDAYGPAGAIRCFGTLRKFWNVAERRWDHQVYDGWLFFGMSPV